MENFRILAAVIAAHPNHKVVGRTRLQKTINLLQRRGLPSDYKYMNHFYGPYSGGLQADINVLESLGLVTEATEEGSDAYVFVAKKEAELEQMVAFQHRIGVLSGASLLDLELAATYEAFRDLGSNEEESLVRLRQKKGRKATAPTEKSAFDMLQRLDAATEEDAKTLASY